MNAIVFSGNLNELNEYENQRKFLENLIASYSQMSDVSQKSTDAVEKLNQINLDDSEAVQEYTNFLMQNNIGGLPRL